MSPDSSPQITIEETNATGRIQSIFRYSINKILFLLKKYQILFLISGQEINKN
jgi:hypothetical protein